MNNTKVRGKGILYNKGALPADDNKGRSKYNEV